MSQESRKVAGRDFYPKPGALGGRLIRQVVGFLRERGEVLPIDSDILIATSAGADSVALAHLITHYGRRIASKSKITLLHVNHRWRGAESDADEAFVNQLGTQWGVPVITHRLKKPKNGTGESLEEVAREARKKIFIKEAQKRNALVLTAHHADDLAETVLWRLFTGGAQTHGGGIAFRHGVELRPFLKTRKAELKAYLQEVGQSYREDSTNQSDRFLRARMRSQLLPEVQVLFPKAVEHLVALALTAQNESTNEIQKGDELPHFALLQAAGLKPRRPHFELIYEKLVANRAWYGEIHLPGGWKLFREKKKAKSKVAKTAALRSNKEPPLERWILERI